MQMTQKSVRTKSTGVAAVVSVVALLAGCQTLQPLESTMTASLRTDSAVVGVHHGSYEYFAKIGFVFTNTTSKPVSKAGCGNIPGPSLEKNVDGKWVSAYSPVYLLCLTKPDWSLAAGASYHGELEFYAFERGHNTYPILDVDTIDGTYRLRWQFAEGTDATAPDARRVESTSNEFRLFLIKP
jgi:hypothetical protein